MTKAREPDTFPDGVTRVAGLIGWAAAADAVGKVERAVRAWSDPDSGRYPCIDDCLALDAAYITAGGGDPPLLGVYMRRLEAISRPPASLAEVVEAGAHAMRASGEFAADLMAAAQPGATPAMRKKALREATDAADAIVAAAARLNAADDKVTPLTRSAA